MAYTTLELGDDLDDMNVLLARKSVPLLTKVTVHESRVALLVDNTRIAVGTPIECWRAAIEYVRDQPFLQPYSVFHVSDEGGPLIAIEHVMATRLEEAIEKATTLLVLVDPIVFTGHLLAAED